ncbi:unnamed protein product [Amoebophrya sp. A25]|nr:unnamed protein product [Amoebophrya sp. A25]|eukprot:GSA25T00012375001.1
MLHPTPISLSWHYKYWQRQTAGFLRNAMRNKKPNDEMVGYVTNDKHPKSIRVACDRWMWVMRYKKCFRYCKKIWAHDEKNDARLGDVVRVQPLGYRLGPWKTYVLTKVLYREPRDEGSLRGSDARNLNYVPPEQAETGGATQVQSDVVANSTYLAG